MPDRAAGAARRPPAFWALYSVLVVVLAAGYARRNAGYASDEVFITLRYAENLEAGHGLVFNPDERYHGDVSPGYAAALALTTVAARAAGEATQVGPLARLDVARAAIVLSALGLVAVAFAIGSIRLGIADGAWFGACALISWGLFTSTATNALAGHPDLSAMAAAFVGGLLLVVGRRPTLGAFVFAVATAISPWAVASMVVAAWGARRERAGWRRFAVAYAVLMATWLLIVKWQTGSFFSMADPRALAGAGLLPASALATLTGLAGSALGVLGAIGATAGIAIGAFVFATEPASRSRLAPAMVFVATALMPLSACAWRLLAGADLWPSRGDALAVALAAAGVCGSLLGLERLTRLAQDLELRDARLAAAVLLAPLSIVILLVAPTLARTAAWWRTGQVNPGVAASRPLAMFLEEQGQANDIVFLQEPGPLAFQLGRRFRVIDDLSLMSPPHGGGAADDTAIRLTPRFVVCSAPVGRGPCDARARPSGFSPAREFADAYWTARAGRSALILSASTSARPPAGIAMDRISHLVLGDRWGLLRKTEQDDTVFIHPGQTSATEFDYECAGGCDDLMVEARISPLPPEAPAEAGRVGLAVLSGAEPIIPRAQVTPANPASFVLEGGRSILHVVVDNDGNPLYDWVLLRFSR